MEKIFSAEFYEELTSMQNRRSWIRNGIEELLLKLKEELKDFSSDLPVITIAELDDGIEEGYNLSIVYSFREKEFLEKYQVGSYYSYKDFNLQEYSISQLREIVSSIEESIRQYLKKLESINAKDEEIIKILKKYL